MSNNKTETSLSWTPEGKRKRGRPKTTWWRTVERERATVRDGVGGMRQWLLQPTEKIAGILWKPYVPGGTKKLGNGNGNNNCFSSYLYDLKVIDIKYFRFAQSPKVSMAENA